MDANEDNTTDLASVLYETYSNFYAAYTKEENKNIHINKFELSDPIRSLIKTFISDILTSQTCYRGTSFNIPFFSPIEIEIQGDTETYCFKGNIKSSENKMGVDYGKFCHNENQSDKESIEKAILEDDDLELYNNQRIEKLYSQPDFDFPGEFEYTNNNGKRFFAKYRVIVKF